MSFNSTLGKHFEVYRDVCSFFKLSGFPVKVLRLIMALHCFIICYYISIANTVVPHKKHKKYSSFVKWQGVRKMERQQVGHCFDISFIHGRFPAVSFWSDVSV